MTQNLDIFQLEDGFYVGRKLKSGKMAKGAYKLTGNDIMTMFTKFFTDYCKETQHEKLLMRDGDGGMFVTMRIEPKHE